MNEFTSQNVSKLTPAEVREKILASYIKQEKTVLRENDFHKNRQIISLNNTINTINPIFTWYTSENHTEKLYEAKFTVINSAYYNKLYVMLSKIREYNAENNSVLSLVLILCEENDNKIGVSNENIDDISEIFKPAIQSKLLEIKTVKI